ncbi:MAG TPA: hypothetical protein VH249_16815 [Xanthobacteraceae bacterium]|nr:hypothetical protein [Xanthobacteraceae bacterium]
MERMPTMCIKLPSIQQAGVAAALAAMLLLRGPAAQAGEVITRNCLHGFSDAYRSAESQDYSGEYGSAFGDSHSFSRSNSDSRTGFRGGLRRAGFHGGFRGGFRHAGSHGGFRGGFRHAGFHGGLIGGNGNGPGSTVGSGSDGGHTSGYADGNSHQTGSGSSSGDSSDSCVEVRRELTNPYVIQVQGPQSPEERAEANEQDRLWQARCRPTLQQDMFGINRYSYAAPGCEYGKTK